MNSRLVISIVTAAFIMAPSICSAQRGFGPTRLHELTLLTGPFLLSPASPPQSPVAGQQWVFVKAVNPADASRPVAAAPSTLLPRNAYSLSSRGAAAESSPLALQPNGPAQGPALEINASPQFRFEPGDQTVDPRGQLRAAEERSQRIRAEREAALKRRTESAAPQNQSADSLRQAEPAALPRDPIRFDAYVPAMPTHLLPASAKPARP